jgi:chaperonin cofactor prefoldin
MMKETMNMVGSARHYDEMRSAHALGERRASVLTMLEELEQIISELACSVDQTEAQLQPVLLPEPPQADKESPTGTRSVSQVMETLDNQIQRLRYQNRRIQQMSKRLAI